MKRKLNYAIVLLLLLTLCACGGNADTVSAITLGGVTSNGFEDSLLPFGMSIEDAYKCMGKDASNDLDTGIDVSGTFTAQFENPRTLHGTEVVTSVTFSSGVVSAVSYQPVDSGADAQEMLEAAIEWNKKFLELYGEDGYQTAQLGTWETASGVALPIEGRPRSVWVRGETQLSLSLESTADGSVRYYIAVSKA